MASNRYSWTDFTYFMSYCTQSTNTGDDDAYNIAAALLAYYSRTPLIRPPSESHWCGRIRGMVAREGFVYEQKPLPVTRNVVV